MFGKLFGAAVDLVTLPVDIVDVGVDLLSGGDGSKKSREGSLISPLLEIRDDIADDLRNLDKN